MRSISLSGCLAAGNGGLNGASPRVIAADLRRSTPSPRRFEGGWTWLFSNMVAVLMISGNRQPGSVKRMKTPLLLFGDAKRSHKIEPFSSLVKLGVVPSAEPWSITRTLIGGCV